MYLRALFLLLLWANPLTGSNLDEELSQRKGSEQTDYIAARIKANNGTPIVEGRVVHFFFKPENGSDTAELRLIGDFNDWGHQRGPQPGGTPMKKVGAFFHFKIELKPEARIEYQFVLGDRKISDPLNPMDTWAWDGRASIVAMPGSDWPAAREPAHDVPRGEVTLLDFKSDYLRNSRKVHIYTPPGYDKAGAHPTLYLGDGTLFVEQGQIPRALDDLIARKKIPPVIAVFVDPVNRFQEYRMNVLYRMMVLSELMPFVEETYSSDSKNRVVIGFSRGALMAADLALTHPELFSAAILLSPATQGTDFDALCRRYEALKSPNLTILLTTYDHWYQDGVSMHKILSEKGWPVTVREVPEGHNINTWRVRLAELLPTVL